MAQKDTQSKDSSTFTKYLLRMPKKSAGGNDTLLSRQEDTMSVTETASVIKKKDDEGKKFINQYMIIKGLGRYILYCHANL